MRSDSDDHIITEEKRDLSGRFKMTDLVESQITLGMEISRDRVARSMSIFLSNYTLNMIDSFGLRSARDQSTPMDFSLDLSASGDPFSEPYREAIGWIMYLMVGTRPDFAFYICALSKHVQTSP